MSLYEVDLVRIRTRSSTSEPKLSERSRSALWKEDHCDIREDFGQMMLSESIGDD